MHMTRLSRRDQGSALVIATIMIVVTSTMIAVLLASPTSQLNQVAEATAKERATLNADAGIRDAVVWLTYRKANLSSWTVNGSHYYVSRKDGVSVSSAIPSGQTQKTGLLPDPSTTDLILVHNNAWLGITGSKGSPAFEENNFKSFGDAKGDNNKYAYVVTNENNGYYRVICEGRARAGAAARSLDGSDVRFVSTIIEAYIVDPIVISNNPAAVTFLNRSGAQILNKDLSPAAASGWTNPAPTVFTAPASNPPSVPMIYSSTKGGGGDKIENTPSGFINGDDLSAGNQDTNAVAIQNGGFQFDNSTGVASSTTSAVVNASSGMVNSVGSLVDTVKNLPSGNGVDKYVYSGSSITVGSATPKITYVNIPDNTVVTSDVFRFNGSSTYAGILIVDVGNNVQFNFALGSVSLFAFNGNPNQALGAFVFNQRGTMKLPQDGLYLADNRGNATDKLHWDSYSYQQALTNLPTTLKFVSYRVKK
jgi:Tfp pilus assembly protein PilX